MRKKIKKRKEKKRKEKKRGRRTGPNGANGESHMYRGIIHTGTNIHICTRWDTRYKCSTAFVPDALYLLDTQYK
jgi:hypothetical protein